jgi:hypothetical protein
MAPKYHPTPLSGGDRKALAKELGKARAMANILAAQSAEMRAKGQSMIQQADRLLCESWNERMWSDGEPIDPSPTIDQAVNGGFPWLEIRCARCKTPSDVDLAPMVPGLFNPAEIAGRRLDDVRVYYSRQTGPIKRRHVKAHRERLHGVVDLIAVEDPQVHAKFLLWGKNNVVVSTMNWGSQSGSPDNPLDEVGLHLEGPGVAMSLLAKFEEQLED